MCHRGRSQGPAHWTGLGRVHSSVVPGVPEVMQGGESVQEQLPQQLCNHAMAGGAVGMDFIVVKNLGE